MNCEQVEQYLRGARDRPAEPLPEDVLTHLLTCERCRGRDEFRDVDLSEWEPSLQVRRRIRAQMAGYLSPVTPVPAQATLILLTVAILVIVPSLVLGVIGDGALHVMTLLQFMAWIVVIGAAEGMLSVSVAGLMVPGCRHRLHPQLLVLLCIAAYLATALLFFRRRLVANPVQEGAGCLLIGCGAAIPAAFVLWLLTRKGSVLSWPLTGSVIGLLAGLVGTSVLLFHCTLAEKAHLAVWHTGVLMLCTLAGLSFGMIFRSRSSVPYV
ncbi:MAG: NrsF family protein [Bryobacteraceae bacterium]